MRVIPNLKCESVLSRNIYATNPSTGLAIDGVTCKSGLVQVANGSAGSPSLCFTTGTGLYRSAASSIALATAGIGRLTVADTSASVDTITTFNATTTSSDTTSGAIVVYGGLGLAKNMYVTGSVVTAGIAGLTTQLAGDTIAAGFVFGSDPDTGVYRVGADQLGIATNNANKFTLSTTAAIFASGIATTTFNSATDSSSTSTGSIVVAGSMNVGGNVYVGQNVTAQAVGAPNIRVTSFGTVSAPVFTFTGYTNTGFYFNGSSALPAFSVGGYNVLKMEWSSMSLGNISNYDSTYSTAVGYACISRAYSTVIGNYANQWSGTDTGVCIGASAVSQASGVCIGASSWASSNSTAIGALCTAGHTGSVVMGYNLSSVGAGYVTIGSNIAYSYLQIGSTSWSGNSDERLKKDITDLLVGMDLVRKIEPITYKWKDGRGGPDKTHQGFSYQRLCSNLSDVGYEKHEAVGKSQEYGDVGPEGLLPHIVRAIEELAKKLDQNEVRVQKKLSGTK